MDHVRSIRNADEAARLFSGRLSAFLRRRISNREVVEDLLQEVMLRVTRHEETLAAVNNPAAWLLTVTRSVIADHYRRTSRSGMEVAAGLELPDGMEEDQPAPISMLSDCVAPLLAHLPDKYQDALRRSDLGGETLVSLAEEEGLSASALKSRAQRARKMLREAIVASCETELDRRGRLVSAGEMKKGCC